MFLYEIDISRKDYQFFDTLKTKHRKINKIQIS